MAKFKRKEDEEMSKCEVISIANQKGGVGKTHLAISLGIAAAKKRYLTYFISCHDLIMQLKKAHAEID